MWIWTQTVFWNKLFLQQQPAAQHLLLPYGAGVREDILILILALFCQKKWNNNFLFCTRTISLYMTGGNRSILEYSWAMGTVCTSGDQKGGGLWPDSACFMISDISDTSLTHTDTCQQFTVCTSTLPVGPLSHELLVPRVDTILQCGCLHFHHGLLGR